MKRTGFLTSLLLFFSVAYGQRNMIPDHSHQASEPDLSGQYSILELHTVAPPVDPSYQTTISDRGSSAANGGQVFPLAPPANDNCANAISLTVDAACINGTTKQSTTQTGEPTACQGAINQTVWYKFVATSTSLYVEVERTASSGCYLSSAVYSGSCLPSTNLSCEDAAFGPNLNIHNLTGLTIGTTYYIQVSYTAGMFCGSANNSNTGADFCIKVGTPQSCATCSTPCGPLCVFGSTPTVTQVTSTCPEYPLQSRMNDGDTRTQCYTFTATSTSFNLQMIISGNCSGGNVYTFDWQLYPASCSGVIQSGTLANLTATGLTTGANYVLCYTWTASCQHNSVYPYIVSTIPLPVELLHFDGQQSGENILLQWATVSETDNDYFSLQRSENGTDFKEIARVKGAGNSTHLREYSILDENPGKGLNYYRLVQVDYNNESSASDVIGIKFISDAQISTWFDNSTGKLVVIIDTENPGPVNLSILNYTGQLVYVINEFCHEGRNNFNLEAGSLAAGIYFIKAEGEFYSAGVRFAR